jgi:tetratricopeptide (TPR) repeat protein
LGAQKYISQEIYNKDSLLSILEQQTGQEKVNSLNCLADHYSYTDFSLSIRYLDESIDLARKTGYEKGLARAYQIRGYVNLFLSRYIEALNSYHKAQTIYEKFNMHKELAGLYLNISILHYFAANYEKAIESSMQALRIYRKILQDGNTICTARDTLLVHNALGMIYTDMGMGKEALERRLLYLRYGIDNNFDPVEMMLMTWICGASYLSTGQVDSAVVYFNRALEYPENNINITAQKYRVISWMASIWSNAGEYKRAISALIPAFEWYKTTGLNFWAMYFSNQLGFIHLKINDLQGAEYYYRESELLFNEMVLKDSWYRHDSLRYIVSYGLELYFPLPFKFMKEMMWDYGSSMYYFNYITSEAQHDDAGMIKYLKLMDEAKDTLRDLKRNREMVELQIKYETERKDLTINNLERENEFKDLQIFQTRIILFALIVIVLTIIIIAFLLVRQARLHKSQENLILQQKLFRSQMNPHFIFNSLASLQHMMITGDMKKSSSYFDSFSELLRSIINNSSREYITLLEELNTITNYLILQQIRYKDKFSFSVEVDENIDRELCLIPPMLAQPFIENAIEHGIKHKQSQGHIQIRCSPSNGSIIYEVEDDGIGREKAREISSNDRPDHQSFATSITLERIATINKRSKDSISLNIIDLKDKNMNAAGTLARIEIPVIK